MNLQERIELISELGSFFRNPDSGWEEAKLEASRKNPWFTFEFIDAAMTSIMEKFLQKDLLTGWAAHYCIDDPIIPKNVGIVMAGNIPLVGFHDFLATFISGHRQTVKMSAKDDVLLKFIFEKLAGIDPGFQKMVMESALLKGSDAYIATGSNNSARYFEQYFSKYPHIIRRNKTSVAILTGNETASELECLADDIHLYFGLGCRNVTKLFVPEKYDFVPLIRSFDKYAYFMDHQKYKNNYDYQLSISLLNRKYYMTNGNTLLIEDPGNFSPISVVHYEYDQPGTSSAILSATDEDIQCRIGHGFIPFGQAQHPGLFTYADGVDTMQFLLSL